MRRDPGHAGPAGRRPRPWYYELRRYKLGSTIPVLRRMIQQSGEVREGSNFGKGQMVVAFADSCNQMVTALRGYKAQTVKGGLGKGGRLGVDGGTTPASNKSAGHTRHGLHCGHRLRCRHAAATFPEVKRAGALWVPAS